MRKRGSALGAELPRRQPTWLRRRGWRGWYLITGDSLNVYRTLLAAGAPTAASTAGGPPLLPPWVFALAMAHTAGDALLGDLRHAVKLALKSRAFRLAIDTTYWLGNARAVALLAATAKSGRTKNTTKNRKKTHEQDQARTQLR